MDSIESLNLFGFAKGFSVIPNIFLHLCFFALPEGNSLHKELDHCFLLLLRGCQSICNREELRNRQGTIWLNSK